MADNTVSFLSVIAGGRTRDATIVREAFDDDAEEMKNTHEHVAGFLIVTWDDEGFMKSSLHEGERSPYKACDLRSEITTRLNEHLSDAN